MRNTDKLLFVAGLVMLFAGLDVAILLSHLSRAFGIPLIVLGAWLVCYSTKKKEPILEKKEAPPEKESIASSVINIITLKGRLKPALPILGILAIVLLLTYNLALKDQFYLGSNDYVTLILASVLLAYNYVPQKYSVERDFAFLFALLLFVILVIPTTLLSLGGGGQPDTNTPIVYYLLSLPAATLARLFGIDAVTPGQLLGFPAYNAIEFTGPDGILVLNISLSCSGLYSVSIFVSAFIAYVAVEHRRLTRRILAFLGLGIFLAWLANVIRMAIILMVGNTRGQSAMLWTHNNIGEVIFMVWVTIFWLFMFRYLDPQQKKPPRSKKAETLDCQLCGEPLSPSIRSSQCKCGAISHSDCLAANKNKCPKCGAKV
jgi:archaeosortase C (PEF-CTERM variant)